MNEDLEPPVLPVEAEGLPPTFLIAFVDELRRSIRPPYEVMVVVACNAGLACVLWFFSPTWLYDAMFNVHSLLLFPMVLAMWMFSDVPATNELGPDRLRMSAALDDRVMIERLLRAKHLVLWCLVSPVALIAALLVGLSSHDPVATLLTMGWILIVPFSMLGLSCFIGVRWPYHPIHVRIRWEHRSEWRTMWLRWGILILVPYLIVPMMGLISLAPAMGLRWLIQSGHPSGNVDHVAMALGIAASMIIGVTVWSLGTREAASLAVHRREELRAYLAEPMLG